ncbi:MAG TPA: hypothetical protein VN641_07130, partial [Urbifossiella sp.]|nr:hypothetical protein [Urbifossiella sp.]
QGWRTLAAELDRFRDRLQRETGAEPLVAGMLWKMPGELSFYCRGQPECYSFGAALADRHSQYELWRPNPVSDPDAFRGKDFLYVGEEIPDAPRIFDSVEPPILVVHRDGGIPVAAWKIWVCRGFRGFPPRQSKASY